MLRRTKIVATVGPATATPEQLERLWREGVDIFRLNFSHGNLEEKRRILADIRSLPPLTGREAAVLADLQGPRIRVGRLLDGGILLEENSEVIMTTRDVIGHGNLIPTDYSRLPDDVCPGSRILLDEGQLEIEVIESVRTEIRCWVVIGGFLKERKGINLPGINISAPILSARDMEDLQFCMENGVDLVGLSFVRSAAEVVQVKEIISRGGAGCRVISKIERQEAIEDFDAILQESDGVMIARGDLGVELGPERVPLIQKDIIRRCNRAGKPVITATQMLESMMRSSIPTRAETSDVANAILDGTDAVMLSGETAIGKYPIQAVQVLKRVSLDVENTVHDKWLKDERKSTGKDLLPADAIAQAACSLAKIVGAKAVLAFTRSGRTAMLISKYRPVLTVLAFTPSIEVQRYLSLMNGVYSFQVTLKGSVEDQLRSVESVIFSSGIMRQGEKVVIAMGCPVKIESETNLLKVHRLGEEHL
ncbi:MAG: pyruvate kinase [Proteobacteria bacterium]|nr:pyruvate kinase [Pseudomonadota bacterium]MBU1710102.1 pyruvate kinase [Pseudomonadota bacterium]